MEELLTIDELSELLKIGKSTIYHWTCAGFIPHTKVGRFLRFRASDVEEWLQNRNRLGRSSMAIRIGGHASGLKSSLSTAEER